MGIMRPCLSIQIDQEEEEEKNATLTNLTLGLYYAITKSAKYESVCIFTSFLFFETNTI